MRPNEQKTAPTEKNLMAIGHGLSFHAEQAWMFSTSYIASYLHDHASQYTENGEYDDEGTSNETGDAGTSDVAALMAAGRLDWLLRKARPSLSGLLSESDILTLLDCFQGGMFFPDQFDSIASDLCDHLGIALSSYEGSRIAPLVAKLLGLNLIQRVALADALEQTWHRGMKQEGKSLKEFFATLGIDLT